MTQLLVMKLLEQKLGSHSGVVKDVIEGLDDGECELIVVEEVTRGALERMTEAENSAE